MKRLLPLLLLAGLLWAPSTAAAADTVLIDDEFNGPLDTSVWTANDSGQWFWDYLTRQTAEGSVAHPGEVTVSGGELHLGLSKTSYLNHTYRAGYVSTYGKVSLLYGKVEATMKVSGGAGMWPAFWMLPTAFTEADMANSTVLPEIDIFEILGSQQSKTDWMTLHNENSADKTSCTFNTVDLSQAYHTYAIDWQPGRLTWLVDGVQRCTTTKAVPSEPMWLIINNSAGGCASWGGCIQPGTTLPTSVDVKNVKVTQGVSAPDPTVNDSSSAITYSGTWRTSTARGYGDYGDDVHYSSVNGDSASYTFTGTGIDYIGEKNTDIGEADVYLDGVFKQTVNGSAASRQVQQALYSVTGLPAGSHTIKVVKKSGTYLVIDAFRPTTTAVTANDTSAAITYAGTWRTSTARGYGDYGDDVHYSSVNGDSASFTFTGTGVDYIGEKYTDIGEADVYLDGVFKQTVNGSAASRQVQQALYSVTGLPAGSHTIKVVKKSGTYLVIDAFTPRT
ncbi:family 16 glycosylhydrolase [Nonomuraea sp. NPDC050556]|uniref:family 16 glycosylhydrolase n=1 Tax=Nonomuraea sp. NPDC050556 TaxID=3364369 RepID=UPI0037B62C35